MRRAAREGGASGLDRIVANEVADEDVGIEADHAPRRKRLRTAASIAFTERASLAHEHAPQVGGVEDGRTQVDPARLVHQVRHPVAGMEGEVLADFLRDRHLAFRRDPEP